MAATVGGSLHGAAKAVDLVPMAQATTGAVAARGTGSPNRLLFSRDTTLPGRVAALALTTGRGHATLSWANPGDLDLARIDVRVAEGTTPPAPHRGLAGMERPRYERDRDQAQERHRLQLLGVHERRRRQRPRTHVDPSAGTNLSASVSETHVVLGSEAKISGRLTAGGDAVAGWPVELLVRRQGTSSWSRVATLNTSSTGQVRHRHAPRWNVEYMLRFPGRSPHLGSDSPQVNVAVRQQVTANLSATTIPRGTRATLTGTVPPRYAGETIDLQQKVDGAWRNNGRTTLSATGSYRFVLEPTRRGTYSHRVHRPAPTTPPGRVPRAR